MMAFEFLWDYLPTIMTIMAIIWILKGVAILMKGGRRQGGFR